MSRKINISLTITFTIMAGTSFFLSGCPNSDPKPDGGGNQATFTLPHKFGAQHIPVTLTVNNDPTSPVAISGDILKLKQGKEYPISAMTTEASVSVTFTKVRIQNSFTATVVTNSGYQVSNNDISYFSITNTGSDYKLKVDASTPAGKTYLLVFLRNKDLEADEAYEARVLVTVEENTVRGINSGGSPPTNGSSGGK